MKVIKNKNGIFVELPREHIKFYGNTEEEKKANELIFDLSLENDSLYQQINQLTNNWNDLEEWVKKNSWYYNTSDGCQWVDQFKLLDKMKEIKEGNNVSSRD